MQPTDGILFTAFEPSGDEHAAPVIARLRALRPDLPIYALGGPQMQAAGAVMLEDSTRKAAMLLGAASQMFEHRRRLQRLEQWLAGKKLAALVPVDSPAANWSICSLIRKRQPQARIVHLVAPQLWAWASWRISKLRRLTDRVLCLLPFEPAWFEARGVSAVCVGHPSLDPQVLTARRAQRLENPPQGRLKLTLLPGSRMGEIKANWPTMLAVMQLLRQRHPEMAAVVAVRDEQGRAMVQQVTQRRHQAQEQGWQLRTGETDAALAWADLVLAVSGTVTLHAAAHLKPMVVLYNISPWSWHLLGRWIVHARTLSLPNLVSESAGRGRAVPEFMPHFGAVEPVMRELDRLASDPAARQAQVRALEQVLEDFRGPTFAAATTEEILRQIQPNS